MLKKLARYLLREELSSLNEALKQERKRNPDVILLRKIRWLNDQVRNKQKEIDYINKTAQDYASLAESRLRRNRTLGMHLENIKQEKEELELKLALIKAIAR